MQAPGAFCLSPIQERGADTQLFKDGKHTPAILDITSKTSLLCIHERFSGTVLLTGCFGVTQKACKKFVGNQANCLKKCALQRGQRGQAPSAAQTVTHKLSPPTELPTLCDNAARASKHVEHRGVLSKQ
jgi:hypothetical protein